MILLNQIYLQRQLPQGEVLVFDEIDSTNEYLLTHCDSLTSGSICLAESQSAGRGRRGRQWYSPLGQNLYFSLLWKYPPPPSEQLASLSLIVALIIAETFETLGVEDIQIKWPNDIYYQGKKAGGILIESKLDRNGIALIIGVGLNLAMNAVDPHIVNQAWSDLAKYHLDRNTLAATLAERLQKMLADFPHTPLCTYLERWRKFDCFYQKPVKLITAAGDIHGIAQGINEKGELLLQQEDRLSAFAIGELSLRAA